jgi:hypothetical protein
MRVAGHSGAEKDSSVDCLDVIAWRVTRTFHYSGLYCWNTTTPLQNISLSHKASVWVLEECAKLRSRALDGSFMGDMGVFLSFFLFCIAGINRRYVFLDTLLIDAFFHFAALVLCFCA